MKGNEMRRDDVFPSRYLKAADLNGRARVLEIAEAPLQAFKNANGEEKSKTVLYFVNEKKCLPLNMVNWDAVASICGDDTKNWPTGKVEVFPSTTSLGGKTGIACIRIRPPTAKPRSNKPALRTVAAEPSPPRSEDPSDGMDGDPDEEIP
jgi:hypothetical protein